MGTSTTSSGLYQHGGQPVGGMLGSSPFGKAYFVDYEKGNDSNDGRSSTSAVKTLSQAISLVTSNNNDVIYVDGYSTVVETAMVSLTKNRVTIVGINGGYGHFGQGAKISVGVTTAATDIATFKNTGVRNTFIGLKFINENTVDEGLYCVAEGGEFARYFNCEFYKSTDLDETAAAELLHNGDSAMFYNCTFGSTANIIADNKIRPNVLLTATLSGKKCRDSYLENCLFLSKAGGTEHVAVYGANATDVERMLMLKDCTFLNNSLSAATPAHAVGFGAAQTQGTVFLKDCSAVDHTVMAEIDMGTWVDGGTVSEGATGIAVQEVT